MNAITERFLGFIDNQGLSDYQVWNSIDGLSKSSMSKIRGGLIDVSIKVIAPFCAVYGVDANWLLNGEGDMLKTSASNNSSSSVHDNVEDVAYWKHVALSMSEEVAEKKDIIKDLKEKVKRLGEELDRRLLKEERRGASGNASKTA